MNYFEKKQLDFTSFPLNFHIENASEEQQTIIENIKGFIKNYGFKDGELSIYTDYGTIHNHIFTITKDEKEHYTIHTLGKNVLEQAMYDGIYLSLKTDSVKHFNKF